MLNDNIALWTTIKLSASILNASALINKLEIGGNDIQFGFSVDDILEHLVTVKSHLCHVKQQANVETNGFFKR